jgi:hypothetical protein
MNALSSTTAPLPAARVRACLLPVIVSESPEYPGFRREARRAAEGWAADLHIRTK